MPRHWEGNHRSGVALAMCHGLKWFIHLWAQRPLVGDEHPAYAPAGAWLSLPLNMQESKFYMDRYLFGWTRDDSEVGIAWWRHCGEWRVLLIGHLWPCVFSVLKSLEFSNISSSAESSSSIPSLAGEPEKPKTLETLLLEKNRSLQTENTQLKVANNDLSGYCLIF